MWWFLITLHFWKVFYTLSKLSHIHTTITSLKYMHGLCDIMLVYARPFSVFISLSLSLLHSFPLLSHCTHIRRFCSDCCDYSFVPFDKLNIQISSQMEVVGRVSCYIDLYFAFWHCTRYRHWPYAYHFNIQMQFRFLSVDRFQKCLLSLPIWFLDAFGGFMPF